MSGDSNARYRDSRIDWEQLRSLASRVAIETKVRRGTRVVTEEIARTRPIRTGLFGLRQATEEYVETQDRTATDNYWVLESRYWQRKEKATKHSPEETTREWTRHCLGVDGSLFMRLESACEVFPIGGGYLEEHQDPTIREMTESDVILLDFASKYQSWTERRFSGETNRESDESRRTARSKGDGLLQKLMQMLPNQ